MAPLVFVTHDTLPVYAYIFPSFRIIRVLLGRRHPVPAEVADSASTPKTGHIRVLLVWPCGSPTYEAGRKSSSNLVQPNQLHEITCGYRNECINESGFLLRGTLPQRTHGGRGGVPRSPLPPVFVPTVGSSVGAHAA